jgi:hypothetical protein
MSNQLLINPYPLGVCDHQIYQELNGSIQLAGSAVTTGEPINWNDLISGVGYNEINYLGNGVHGNGTALVTTLSGDGTTVTATAANNFSIGEKIRFKNCTTAMGLLLNGVSVTIATASSSQFTFLNASNTTGSGEVGMAIVDKTVNPLLVGPTQPQTVTVTAVSASGSIATITAANNLLPGASVTFGTFTTGTLGPLLVAAGPLPVIRSTTSAFTVQMPSALSGTTGACTAIGVNPPQPFSVLFWSGSGSGYEYTYSSQTGVLYAQTVAGFTPAGTIAIPVDTNVGTTGPVYADTVANHLSTTGAATSITNAAFTGTAVTAAGLAALAAAAYPAGVLGDLIKFTAKFPKMVQF